MQFQYASPEQDDRIIRTVIVLLLIDSYLSKLLWHFGTKRASLSTHNPVEPDTKRTGLPLTYLNNVTVSL